MDRHDVPQTSAEQRRNTGQVAPAPAPYPSVGDTRVGTVYFIEAEGSGHIKIGIAQNVFQRLAALQTGNAEPLRVRAAVSTYRARELERELHQRFAGDRLCGEWFRASERLAQYISEYASGWSKRLSDGSLVYPFERTGAR